LKVRARISHKTKKRTIYVTSSRGVLRMGEAEIFAKVVKILDRLGVLSAALDRMGCADGRAKTSEMLVRGCEGGWYALIIYA